MLLETLLLSPCFLSGKTSFKDSKTTLYIDKKQLEDDEVLLFFDIDDQTKKHLCNIKDENKHRNKVRQLFWGNQEGHRICDFLVFYAKGNEIRVFCFVDLKDNINHLGDATEQVISTYEAFKDNLPDQFKTKFIPKAFICSSNGTLPLEHRKYQDQLNAKFNDYKHDGKPEEFLDFLRGENKKSEKKGKKNKR